MIDDSRKDLCHDPVGELFSGGFALVTGGPKEFKGKMVFLSKQDNFGWWESFDNKGDALILSASWLMPISVKDWDNKTEFDTFIYEARYGL